MQQRRIGSLEVGVVGLGCNTFGRLDADETRSVVDAAIDAGITLFDTADVYGGGLSEEYLGAALRGRRDDVVVATKFGYQPADGLTPGDPRWIARAARTSLERLGTDRIDLYQQHVPDPDVPVAETLGALQQLVEEGLVVEVGCSNVTDPQLREARRVADDAGAPRMVSCQNHYSLLHREPEESVLPACRELEVGFLPFFPLESGVLTGKYRDGMPAGARLTTREQDFVDRFLDAERRELVERLATWAEARGHTLLDLAISWLAGQEVIASVIAGATRPEQVTANVAAAGWTLQPEDRRELDALVTGVRSS